jgi:hypothetical protein
MSTKPELRCPKCDKVVETKGPPSIVVVSDHASGKVHSEKRVFKGQCSEHGWFDDDETPKPAGHHSTFCRRKFKHEFPEALQKELLPQLTQEDRRAFKEMRDGQRRADWDWLSGLGKFVKKKTP